ncbi:iron complex transport system substrate-binding protein [Pasteurella testudinis DSM 23072]|uniref:Iron complex transport system substrate-binding protein n=1 Tax=Pasteurella testudinis DSM 23072 TaxID=1122938 RepID=A0A1W1UXE0_9PAST|nr:ABC transporter substrate-binding protein [Pasteurella testudinis]SMB85404.1 iron complex transport system substrate-binding protein [Pasteurella testudinis DSM 23072]SUB51282.1 Fe(3+) dicitrate-binding periplasmic protein [Pasteurella testudinis]
MRKTWRTLAVTLLATLTVGVAQANDIKLTSTIGELDVPQNPKRIAIFDFPALDILDTLGNQNVVAVPKSLPLPIYLKKYEDKQYVDVGNLMDPNFERLNEAEPDLTIISARQNQLVERFKEISPIYFSDIKYLDFYQSFRQNVRNIAKIIDKEAEAEVQLQAIDQDLASIAAKAKGKTALVLLANESNISAFGPNSRYGMIYQDYGFQQADPNIADSRHGMKVSFEYVLEKNPDYIFVIDRTAAITKKTGNAQKVFDNELIKGAKAHKDGNIVFLDSVNWYLVMGGLQSMKAMNQEMLKAVE